MKQLSIVIIFWLTISDLYSKNYYTSPAGEKTNTGTDINSPLDFISALKLLKAGDHLFLSGGTYVIPYTEGSANTITLSAIGNSNSPISLIAENGAKATIDFSFPNQKWVQDSYGFKLTGSYWIFKNINITRAGYQGVYCSGSFNTFDNCAFYDNRNTGLEINKGGNNTTVLNCDAYRNYDPKKGGSMADGFGPKQTQGPGNKFIGCRSWANSDDGYDCFDSPETVIFENCWAFKNGIDNWNYGGFSGNGNGFKVGGNAAQANIRLTNCVAFDHPQKGFDQNNNTGGITIYNCTGYANGINFGFGGTLNSGQKHTIRNNISLNSTNAISIANANQSNNTWNSGFSIKTSDFLSLDVSLAEIARNPDGTIPNTNLFRLKTSSALVDAGKDVGLEFAGSAPDLGAFETGTTITGFSASEESELIFYPNPTLKSVFLCKPMEWVLFNSSGLEITKGFGTEINLSAFPNNLYFVKTENKIGKIIKQ